MSFYHVALFLKVLGLNVLLVFSFDPKLNFDDLGTDQSELEDHIKRYSDPRTHFDTR